MTLVHFVLKGEEFDAVAINPFTVSYVTTHGAESPPETCLICLTNGDRLLVINSMAEVTKVLAACCEPDAE